MVFLWYMYTVDNRAGLYPSPLVSVLTWDKKKKKGSWDYLCGRYLLNIATDSAMPIYHWTTEREFKNATLGLSYSMELSYWGDNEQIDAKITRDNKDVVC